MDLIEAVEIAVERTLLSEYAQRGAKDPLKSAVSRLCAYPALKLRAEHLRGEVERVRAFNDFDLMRLHSRLGRMTSEQIRVALIKDISADIARTEAEIALLEKTVESIPGGDIARLCYFEDKTDEEVTVLLGCERSTLYRKRKAANQAAAVFLYGEAASG
jgi:hypothetical protein